MEPVVARPQVWKSPIPIWENVALVCTRVGNVSTVIAAGETKSRVVAVHIDSLYGQITPGLIVLVSVNVDVRRVDAILAS
jgi:hypothetical protein